jgi:hypothetical protein
MSYLLLKFTNRHIQFTVLKQQNKTLASFIDKIKTKFYGKKTDEFAKENIGIDENKTLASEFDSLKDRR